MAVVSNEASADIVVIEMTAGNALNAVLDLLAYADLTFLQGPEYRPLTAATLANARHMMSQLEAQTT